MKQVPAEAPGIPKEQHARQQTSEHLGGGDDGDPAWVHHLEQQLPDPIVVLVIGCGPVYDVWKPGPGGEELGFCIFQGRVALGGPGVAAACAAGPGEVQDPAKLGPTRHARHAVSNNHGYRVDVAAEVVLVQKAQEGEAVDGIRVLTGLDEQEVPAIKGPNNVAEEDGENGSVPSPADEGDILEVGFGALEHIDPGLVIESSVGWRGRREVVEDLRQELGRERRDRGGRLRIHLGARRGTGL